MPEIRRPFCFKKSQSLDVLKEVLLKVIFYNKF